MKLTMYRYAVYPNLCVVAAQRSAQNLVWRLSPTQTLSWLAEKRRGPWVLLTVPGLLCKATPSATIPASKERMGCQLVGQAVLYFDFDIVASSGTKSYQIPRSLR